MLVKSSRPRKVYTPAIKPEYITLLYHRAKHLSTQSGKQYPMTRLINDIVKGYLDSIPQTEQPAG